MNEVKRQAMSELQKAVSDAERKAHEMISAERSKMERALAEAKRQASEDALTVINQQEDSSEVSTTDLCPTPFGFRYYPLLLLILQVSLLLMAYRCIVIFFFPETRKRLISLNLLSHPTVSPELLELWEESQ